MKPAVVEISLKSVIKIVFLLILLVLAWRIRFILIAILSAYILMTGFAQLADWFSAKGLNKPLSAALAYLLLILFFALVVFLIVPPLVIEVGGFLEEAPKYLSELYYLYDSNALPGVTSENIASAVGGQLSAIVSNSVSIVLNTVNLVLNFLTIAVLSFYMLVERDRIKNNLFRLFPHLPRERVTKLAHKIEKQLGGWLKGQLILMFIVFLITYVGLTLLKVEYALPLAILAGLLEAVPVLGPILASIPAIVVTFTVSPVAALGVGILYILIQQIENNLLVPKIMQGAIGINPLITIIALLVGANLFGLPGAILAVPLAAIVQVIIYDIAEHEDFT